jgi:pilus assembly protein Flp/PilA
MKKLWTGVMEFLRDEQGATAVEYGVLIALIIGACVVIIGTLGGKLDDLFTNMEAKITIPG